MHEFFTVDYEYKFPISRDPPEGGTIQPIAPPVRLKEFPISRDPPEGGTRTTIVSLLRIFPKFPISRNPPEGGTGWSLSAMLPTVYGFQFLGIPPKGELVEFPEDYVLASELQFPISRDPPEGGTSLSRLKGGG